MINKLREQMKKYFVGKEDIIDNVIICLLSGGHILLEDVPGVGKTTLARTLAKSLDCDFGRIQFTPDTLPSDVVGTEIFNMKTGEFEVRDGAVMHQIILADEINRTSPKTQSSLLEAMSEGQVTIADSKRKLPEPFMVIATQNPIEFVGTYQLPEAQMDRFMMRLSIGYPDADEEIRMAENELSGNTIENAQKVMSGEDIISLKEKVKNIRVSEGVLKYIQEIVALTRKEESFMLGASPRALIALLKASQARAYLCDRDFVKPDDVKKVAVNVLHHRISLTAEAKMRKESVDKKLEAIVLKAKVPME